MRCSAAPLLHYEHYVPFAGSPSTLPWLSLPLPPRPLPLAPVCSLSPPLALTAPARPPCLTLSASKVVQRPSTSQGERKTDRLTDWQRVLRKEAQPAPFNCSARHWRTSLPSPLWSLLRAIAFLSARLNNSQLTTHHLPFLPLSSSPPLAPATLPANIHKPNARASSIRGIPPLPAILPLHSLAPASSSDPLPANNLLDPGSKFPSLSHPALASDRAPRTLPHNLPVPLSKTLLTLRNLPSLSCRRSVPRKLQLHLPGPAEALLPRSIVTGAHDQSAC